MLLIVLSVAWTGTPAQAGEGKIANGKMDLLVFFEFEVNDYGPWQTLFISCNELMFRATDGRLTFGEVRFTTCPEARDKADIRVSSGGGRAFASGGIPGIGVAGRFIQFYEDNRDEPKSLLHELGHYALGCFDEYKGTKRQDGSGGALIEHMDSDGDETPWWDGTGDPATNPWYCVTQAEANGGLACIMDFADGWKAGRANFCLDGVAADAHDVGHVINHIYYRTDQHEVHGHACWAEVAAAVGGAIPTAYPNVVGPPPGPTFKVLDQDAFVVCVDRSGSMFGTPIELAKQGAQVLVSLTKKPKAGPPPVPGTRLGVTSFSTSAGTDFAVAEMTDANKAAANAAIGAIQANGFTAIGSALRLSLNDLVADESANVGPDGAYCSKTIVLLSDGVSNTGESPTGTILQDLRNANVVVHTIGLGGADVGTLVQIASTTGGIFRFANSAAELPGIMTEVFSAATRRLAAGSASGTAAPGASAPVPFTVDGFVREASFVLLGTNPNDPLDVQLEDPTGTPVALDGSNPQVEVVRSGAAVIINVEAPIAGTWTVIVDGSGIATAQDYELILLASSPDLDVVAEPDKQSYVFPEPILVQVRVIASGAVEGATVTATVTDPTGATVATLPLLDDGDTSMHGDLVPQDGTYSNFFSDFTGLENGNYGFEILVDNQAGMTTVGGLAIQPGATTVGGIPVPPFARVVNFSVAVSGIPFGGAPALLPPGSLQLFGTQPGSVRLEWDDTNGGAADTVVQRDDRQGGGFVEIAVVPAGSTAYDDNAIDTVTNYLYRVLARQAGVGESAPSNVVEAQQQFFALSTAPQSGGGGGSSCSVVPAGPTPWAQLITLLIAAAGLALIRRD